MQARAAMVVVALSTAFSQGAAPQAPPRTVDAVDLRRYVGTYYEIARFPNRFQKQCAGNVTATYALRSDGRLDVVNRCKKDDGTVTEARGVARRAARDTSNARLQVRFAPGWLSLLPQVWGDYWVIGTGPDYSYAVIGNPAREFLWILSRVPQMPAVEYQQALEIARRNGYDVNRLVKTRQGM
jgi:apolipoprotein D and lipocalin family protein